MFHRKVFESMNKNGVLQVMDFMFHSFAFFPQFQLLNFGPITNEGYLQIHINWNSLQLILGYPLSQEIEYPQEVNEESLSNFFNSVSFLVWIQCPFCQQWFQKEREDLMNFSTCEKCESAQMQQFQQMYQGGGAQTTLFGQGHISHSGVQAQQGAGVPEEMLRKQSWQPEKHEQVVKDVNIDDLKGNQQ